MRKRNRFYVHSSVWSYFVHLWVSGVGGLCLCLSSVCLQSLNSVGVFSTQTQSAVLGEGNKLVTIGVTVEPESYNSFCFIQQQSDTAQSFHLLVSGFPSSTWFLHKCVHSLPISATRRLIYVIWFLSGSAALPPIRMAYVSLPTEHCEVYRYIILTQGYVWSSSDMDLISPKLTTLVWMLIRACW